MPEKIEAKVAAILNGREVVITAGRQAGVEEGMKFTILPARSFAVKDPDTGQVLDTIEREKARVVASEVREKISICRTYQRVRCGALFDMRKALGLPIESDVVELQYSDNTSDWRSAVDDYVRVGDRVVQQEDDYRSRIELLKTTTKDGAVLTLFMNRIEERRADGSMVREGLNGLELEAVGQMVKVRRGADERGWVMEDNRAATELVSRARRAQAGEWA